MHLWAPGRLQHMQCDLSVMISPEMYERLVIPELEQQMDWLSYPVYHFDGVEQERHLSHLLGLSKLRAIQWTNVDGQAPPRAYLSVLKRIQASGKNLILMTPAEDVPELLDHLSAAGLYLHCAARSPEEADALVRYVERYSRVRKIEGFCFEKGFLRTGAATVDIYDYVERQMENEAIASLHLWNGCGTRRASDPE